MKSIKVAIELNQHHIEKLNEQKIRKYDYFQDMRSYQLKSPDDQGQ